MSGYLLPFASYVLFDVFTSSILKLYAHDSMIDRHSYIAQTCTLPNVRDNRRIGLLINRPIVCIGSTLGLPLKSLPLMRRTPDSRGMWVGIYGT